METPAGFVFLFPFQDYWWFYLAFIVFVLFLLALDLGVFHREAHAVSFREAATWSVVWISLALLFNVGFYFYTANVFSQSSRLLSIDGFNPEAMARASSLEFLTGYIIEKSLSVDNIFVFVMVFSYFAVPLKHQHRVLFFGIIGALIFRAIFIALGSVLMEYKWVVYFFGGFLIFTGVKMMIVPDKKQDPEKNIVIRLFRKLMETTPDYHGPKFFVKLNGVLHATPLFVALLFIELTDIIFAVDSVPAIFAITREPLVVFTSNVFAILGLRSLYFLLAGLVDRFHYLKYGLSVILVFVGLKMALLNELYGGKFPISVSLAIIGGVLAISVALSLLLPKVPEPVDRAPHP